MFTRKEILKITQKQAEEVGLSKEFYSSYKELIKAGIKMLDNNLKIEGIK